MSAAMRLKLLRESAKPKVSIRQMADALQMDHSTYAHYENPSRFKKAKLEVDLTTSIARVLGDHGVDPSAVMQLAGLPDEAPTLLSNGQVEWLAIYDRLTPLQRKLVRQLAEQMIVPDDDEERPLPGPVGGTIHTPRSTGQGDARA